MRLPHKKGEGNKMTKRNLLLVSLLVLFGLAVAAPSLLATGSSPTGVVFYGSNNTNYFIRNEGDAEGVGTITLATSSTGTIKANSAFYITYNAPLANTGGKHPKYAIGVSCTGDVNLCADLAVTVGANGSSSINEVILTFVSDIVVGFPVINGSQIAVAVRVVAQGLAYNQEVLATVRAYYQYSQYPMTVNPLYPATYEVAEVGPSTATTTAFKEGPPTVLTCIGVKDIDYYDNDFSLRITENWPNALTSLSDEFNLEWDTTSGAPANGSNILITLFHIPPGVGISTKNPYSCAEYPTGPHGCPGGALSLSYAADSGITTGSDGLGVESFEYTVNKTSTAVVENGVFSFKLWSHGPLAPNKGYQITAMVDLTDATGTTTSGAPAAMPNFSTDELSSELPVVDFKDCVTKLLFPYVNAYIGGSKAAFANFGTGIVFANTTVDPFAMKDTSGNYIYPDEAVGSAVPQSGNCTVYLYPSDASATQMFTTPVIPAGGSYSFDVGSNVGGFYGKTGYAIAICNFQNAHGFAEIYDNYGIADPTATLGYLADVLPDPAFYHRSPAGDALGEGAIVPVNLDKSWLKLLMYGKLKY